MIPVNNPNAAVGEIFLFRTETAVVLETGSVLKLYVSENTGDYRKFDVRLGRPDALIPLVL